MTHPTRVIGNFQDGPGRGAKLPRLPIGDTVIIRIRTEPLTAGLRPNIWIRSPAGSWYVIRSNKITPETHVPYQLSFIKFTPAAGISLQKFIFYIFGRRKQYGRRFLFGNRELIRHLFSRRKVKTEFSIEDNCRKLLNIYENLMNQQNK